MKRELARLRERYGRPTRAERRGGTTSATDRSGEPPAGVDEPAAGSARAASLAWQGVGAGPIAGLAAAGLLAGALVVRRGRGG